MRSIEICIPALNEEDVIESTLRELLETVKDCDEYQWVFTVVDNGSTDRTAEKVEAMNRSDVRLLQLTEKGKGRAVVSAAKESAADYFGYIDADLSASPRHLRTLIEKIESGASVALGSRLHDGAKVNRSFWRSFVSEAFHRYAQSMVPVSVSDSQCGLKLMDQNGRRVLVDCTETGWWFDREFIAKAEKSGLTVSEVPVDWEEFYYPDRKSKLRVLHDSLDSLVRMNEIRKKVRSYGKDRV